MSISWRRDKKVVVGSSRYDTGVAKTCSSSFSAISVNFVFFFDWIIQVLDGEYDFGNLGVLIVLSLTCGMVANCSRWILGCPL